MSCAQTTDAGDRPAGRRVDHPAGDAPRRLQGRGRESPGIRLDDDPVADDTGDGAPGGRRRHLAGNIIANRPGPVGEAGGSRSVSSR